MCESCTNKDYYICSQTHHKVENGEVAVSVHDRISEAMRITSSDVVFYDIVIRTYSERNARVGWDIIVRRQQYNETMQERDCYRYISDHESLESASESVQEMIQTETPLDRQQANRATGFVSIHLSEEEQSVSPQEVYGTT